MKIREGHHRRRGGNLKTETGALGLLRCHCGLLVPGLGGSFVCDCHKYEKA